MLVDPADLELDPAAEERAAADRNVARNLAVLRGWVDHVAEPGRRRCCCGSSAAPPPAGQGPGDRRRGGADGGGRRGPRHGHRRDRALPPTSSSARSATAGCQLPGLPVDERTATVPNESGRVLRDGQHSAGEYVAGWIKRGPSGVVGTNKHDARETVASLLADAVEGRLVPHGPVGDLVEALVARGAEPVLLDDWHAIDAAEIALGATYGRARTTLHDGRRSWPRSATRRRLLARRKRPGARWRGRRRRRDEAHLRGSVGQQGHRGALGVRATPPAASQDRECAGDVVHVAPLRSMSCHAAAEPSATRHRSTAVQPVTRTRFAIRGRRPLPPGRVGTTTVLRAAARRAPRPAGHPPSALPPAARREVHDQPATGRAAGDQPSRERPRRQPGREVAGAVERVEHDPRLVAATGRSRRSSLSTGTPRLQSTSAAARWAASSAARVPSAWVSSPRPRAISTRRAGGRGRRGAGSAPRSGRRRRARAPRRAPRRVVADLVAAPGGSGRDDRRGCSTADPGAASSTASRPPRRPLPAAAAPAPPAPDQAA